MKKFSKKLIACMLAVMILTGSLGLLTVSASDPISCLWELDGNGNDSLSNIDLSNDNASYIEGKMGQAIDPATGAFLTSAPVTVPAGDVSVSLWFYIPAEMKGWNAFFSTGRIGGSDFLEIYSNADGADPDLRFTVGNKGDNFISTGVSKEQWHHVAFSYNYETQQAAAYLDGAFVNNYNLAGGNYAGLNESVVYIGHEVANGLGCAAKIDNVVFLSSQLSSDQVSVLYNDPAQANADLKATGQIGQNSNFTKALWELNGNTEDALSEINLNSSNPAFADGKLGQGIDLVTGAFLSSDPVTAPASDVSISLWFNMPADTTGWNAFFSTGRIGGSDFLEIYSYADGAEPDLRFTIGNKGDNFISTGITKGVWHHVVVSYDIDTQVAKAYLDGSFINSYNLAGGNYAGLKDTVIYIGHEAANGLGCRAIVDNVYFVMGELSDAQANALYADAEQANEDIKAGNPIKKYTYVTTSFWELDGNGKDIVSGIDFAGNSPAYGEGKDGQGFAPANGSYMQTTSLTGADGDFSMGLWFKVPAGQGTWQPLLTTGQIYNNDFLDIFVKVEEPTISLLFTGAQKFDNCISAEIQADTWYSVMISYSAETKIAKAYLNGEFVVDIDLNGSQFAGLKDTPFYLGYEFRNGIKSTCFIDDVLFTCEALSAEQIKYLYDDPAGAKADLVNDGTITVPDYVAEAKAAATKAIDAVYNEKIGALITDAAKAEALAAYNNAIAAIEAATTVDAVNAAKDSGAAAINSVVDNIPTSDVTIIAVLAVVVLMGAVVVIKRKSIA